jgi:MFS family permease
VNRSGSTDAFPSRAGVWRWYVLAVLTAVYALNIADRFVISVLIEPIKADLRLSDTAVGFLTGVALALFYVTTGLPLAQLADRTNRRNLIAISLAIWSGMTTICGLTFTYWQLLAARVGVGIGEAGGTPPSHALLSDYFPWRQRAFALSVFSVGASLGSMLGSWAGYASDAWGWRSAFLLLGIPGVALAALIALTLREPQRGQLDGTTPPGAASLLGTLAYAARQPALIHCLLGGTIFTLWAWGLMWWMPSYLVRTHHMTLGAAGGSLSLMHGLGGTIVLLSTTVLMRYLAGRDPRSVPWFAATVIAVATVPTIIALIASSTTTTLVMLWLFIPLSYACFGPIFALVQNLVPPNMRAQAVALLLFSSNIANLIIAPQVIGIASDHFAHHYGADSLRIALVPLGLTGFWAAAHFWLTARHLPAGLESAGVTRGVSRDRASASFGPDPGELR